MITYFIFNILLRVIEAYYILLGLYVLLSWFPGAYHTTLGRMVRYFVDPLITPIRRLNLRFGIIDLSALVAFVLLNASRYLLVALYGYLMVL